jgi:hypothetical protein
MPDFASAPGVMVPTRERLTGNAPVTLQLISSGSSIALCLRSKGPEQLANQRVKGSVGWADGKAGERAQSDVSGRRTCGEIRSMPMLLGALHPIAHHTATRAEVMCDQLLTATVRTQ